MWMATSEKSGLQSMGQDGLEGPLWLRAKKSELRLDSRPHVYSFRVTDGLVLIVCMQYINPNF